MLSLQITCGHERTWFYSFRRVFLAMLEIVFVNNLQREGFEDDLFEVFIDEGRVVDGISPISRASGKLK